MVLENPTGFWATEFDNYEDGVGDAEGCIASDWIFGYIYILVLFRLFCILCQ
jgi:hypothetical protein